MRTQRTIAVFAALIGMASVLVTAIFGFVDSGTDPPFTSPSIPTRTPPQASVQQEIAGLVARIEELESKARIQPPIPVMGSNIEMDRLSEEVSELSQNLGDTQTALSEIKESILVNPEQAISLARLSDKVADFEESISEIQTSVEQDAAAQNALSASNIKVIEDKVGDVKGNQNLVFTLLIALVVGIMGLFVTLVIGMGWLRRPEPSGTSLEVAPRQPRRNRNRS